MRNNLGFQFDHSYLALPPCFYTRLNPTPVQSPTLAIFNDNLANQMGLHFSNLEENEKAALLAGNTLLEDAQYFAQAYAGHQFGHFTILGDGRAIVWGEHITPANQRLDIQFKGSGTTPYSRQGDGRAALGPMLREYIVSEAMYHLGIPTTRSLAVVKTGEPVIRETTLPGAILTRVAQSHIRVGTFEFAAYQQDPNITQSLMHYTIKRHYPDLLDADEKAIALLKAVMEKQADLIVQWMRVGFIHGVMNTDNMTLSGETIDYGPCAFMDNYDPMTVFSSIDHMGRYAYQNQPTIAQWNLARLAESLIPFIHTDVKKAIALAEATLHEFTSLYQDKWLRMMRQKLGLLTDQEGDQTIITDLLDSMKNNHADFTNTFRALSQGEKPTGDAYTSAKFDRWYQRWRQRIEENAQSVDDTLKMMKSVNPAVIPRNHQVEKVIAAASNGDLGILHNLLEALKAPYKDDCRFKPYQLPPTESERVYQTFCGT